jgi:hypothetical protein
MVTTPSYSGGPRFKFKPGDYPDRDFTSLSFHILSDSVFLNHTLIRRYIVSAIVSIVK